MPTHKEWCTITGVNGRSEHKLSSRSWDDKRRRPGPIQRRTRMEKFKRNRRLKRVKMCRIDKPRKTHSRNRSGDFRGRLLHQSSSSSSKTRDIKSSSSFSANSPNFKRIPNRRLNIKLPCPRFRQVSNVRAKALEPTVTHGSFGSAFANIFTPGNQPTADIKTKPIKYIPQLLGFDMSYGLFQNYRFLDHFVVPSKF